MTAAKATDLAPGSLEWYWHGEGQHQFQYSDVEAILYQHDVTPATPEDGINSGLVIAYGHPLPRPYRFSIVDDTLLLVNGVQIRPWLRLPVVAMADSAYLKAMSATPWSEDELSRESALSDTCARLVRRLMDTGEHSASAIVDSVEGYLRSSPDVTNTTVETDGQRVSFSFVLESGRPGTPPLCSPHYSEPPQMMEGYIPPDTPSSTEALKDLLTTQVRQDSTLLARGKLLMYSMLCDGSYNLTDFLHIVETMESDSLSWTEKGEALLGSPFAFPRQAKEILYNHEEAEYEALIGGGR